MQYNIGALKKINMEVHKNGEIIYEGPAEEVQNNIEEKYYSKVLELTPEKIVVEI